MLLSKGSRLFFLAAIAITAAALGDPLVESVANSGLLGRGYADNNHFSVIPALVAGVLLIGAFFVHRCVELWRHSWAHRDWVIDIARHVSALSPARDLPLVLALQLAALFAMESAEQLIFGGKLLGGTAWLGGPVLFSLSAHALLGTICAVAVTRGARALLRALAGIIGVALQFIAVAFGRGHRGVFAKRALEPFPYGIQTPRVRELGERAPPLLLALA